LAERPFRIVEVLYPGMTELDFIAPHTVFSRIPGVETIVASLAGGNILSDGGLVFAGTKPTSELDSCDLLFFPGGFPATEMAGDPAFMSEARRLASGARYLTSVCTGSLILAATGLLKGRRAACHWAWRDMLSLFGVIPDPGRVVRDGDIITAGGVTSGLDFALVVAAELAGETFAQALQLGLEYAPAPPFSAGRPETAPPEVLAMVRQSMAADLSARWAQAERASTLSAGWVDR
jgi:putative intracellular protease/amidase